MNNTYQDEKWLRRGHIRKPNKFVLGLYSMFDTVQDFGPMFASMGRGIGKASATTWGFFSRSIMLFINFALVIGIIYLSVGHSYTLLVHSGFSGIAAWVAVAVWEAVFIYCSMLIDNAHRNQRKVGWASWVGFLFGFAFVVISNYMGMADNTIGKIIGISTPILLLVMKKVLEHQFKNEPVKKQKSTSWFSSVLKSKKDDELEEIITEKIELQPTKFITFEDEKTDEISDEKITENTDEIIEEKADEKIEKNEPIEQEKLEDETMLTTEELEDENTPEIMVENSEEKAPEKEDEISSEKIEGKNVDKPKRPKRSSSKKRGRKSNKKTNVNYDQILSIAEQLKNDEKIDADQLEKEIEKEANCSRYFAKKALAELEQKETKKVSENEEVFDAKNERKLYLAK